MDLQTRTHLALVLALAGCSGATSGGAVPSPEASAAASVAAASSSPAAAAGTGVVTGNVAGHSLSVRSAVFMWRDKANDMQVVLADKDGLCEALREGGWPTEATLLYFTLKHNARDNRDAPFTAGDYPVRSGAALPQDTKQASFTRLDDLCTPIASAKATAGVVHVSTKEVALGGTAEGAFELTIGASDTLEGRFTATFCPPPDQEPHGCPALARSPIE